MTSMRWVHYITDLLDIPPGEARSLLGGKGASLQEMSRAGLPVPPAFVITTDACRHYLEKGKAWPDGLADQIRENLNRLERETGRQFGRGSAPLLVSVRSGAAVSMPGMMDTLLNCGLRMDLAREVGDTPQFWRLYIQFITMFGKTVGGIEPEAFARITGNSAVTASRATAEELLAFYEHRTGRPLPQEPWALLQACIDAVFNSWNNERAIAYRARNDIRGLHGTAVTVQVMFPSHVSGILFTRDPTGATRDRMIVEGSWGLGEAVVSGDVTPDRFVVNRENFADHVMTLGRKNEVVWALGDTAPPDPNVASLTGDQLAEVCSTALKVEQHFGAAMDIEWGFAGGKLALLQCRPIRGLEIIEDIETGRRAEIDRLRAAAGGQRRVWIAHNLGETLRFPTPLTWDIVRHFMSGNGGFGRMYQDFGYVPAEQVRQEGFLELICGRIYADPQRLAKLFWDNLPMTYDLDALMRDPSGLDGPPTRFESDRVDGDFALQVPQIVRSMMRTWRAMKRGPGEAKARYEQVLQGYLEYVQARRNTDLSKLSTEQVLSELDDRRRRVLDEFGAESLKPGFFAGLALQKLSDRLTQLMGHEEGMRLAATLTAGLEGDVTFEQDTLLYEVAHGRAAMSDFLERFGHRATGEMELSEPRWREDSSYLEQMLPRLRQPQAPKPHEIHECNVHRREAAMVELPKELERWGGSCFLEEMLEEVKEALELLPYRETGKFHLMMGYELIRRVIVELGRRWDLGDDVFFLRLEELGSYETRRTELKDQIAKRKIRWKSAQRLELAMVIDSQHLDGLGLAPEREAVSELEGDAVASGLATGTARIVSDPRNPGELGDAYVLVCPSTDPGWTPLFLNARGLVVERGGTLSHGAIVARDFGIPAVVCPGATARIPSGATICVDGNRGRVTILEKEQPDAGSAQ